MTTRRASHEMELQREAAKRRRVGDVRRAQRYDPSLSIVPHPYVPQVDSELPQLSPNVVTASAILGSFAGVSTSSCGGSVYSQAQQQYNGATNHIDKYAVQFRFPYPTLPSDTLATVDTARQIPHPRASQFNSSNFTIPHNSPQPSLAPYSSSHNPYPTPVAPPVASPVPKPKQKKVGAKACESCGITDSPEWRKGPSDPKRGKKSLCNACGLKFARSQRKKGLSDETTRLSSSSPSASPVTSRAPTPQSNDGRTASQFNSTPDNIRSRPSSIRPPFEPIAATDQPPNYAPQ